MSLIGLIWVVWIIIGIARANDRRDAKGARAAPKSRDVPPQYTIGFLKVVASFIVFAIASNFGMAAKVASAFFIVPLCLPTLILRTVILPLGWHRCAYYFVRCTYPLSVCRESAAGGVVYGALALARRGATPAKLAWLAGRLAARPSPRMAGDLALGLLAALNGEQRAARLIFHSIDTRAPKFGPRSLRRIARDHLVMDAARQGQWQEVIWRGRRARHSYRWSYAVARMVERLDGRAQACPAWQLRLLWLFAPRRRATLSLLRRALAGPAPARAPAPSAAMPADLAGALAHFARLLLGAEKEGAAPATEQFLSVVRWVDVRLESPATHVHLHERLARLDPLSGGDADAVTRAFRAQLVTLIIPLIERWPSLVQGETERPVIALAVAALEQGAMQNIEVRCDDYSHRWKTKSALDAHAEWASWAELRHAASQLIALAPDAQAAVFHQMFEPICNFAAHLHNVDGRHGLAHDMFAWLYMHANADPDASALLKKNMKAYLPAS
ncbi:MAG: hypothetical protein V4582_02245 [Pseudomonadota bacterium]